MTETELAKAIRESILKSRFWRGGEEFYAGEFTKGCISRGDGRNIRSAEIIEVLSEMVAEGEAEKTGTAMYRRTNKARQLIMRPWRRHSNAELGVESMQFGVVA